MVRHMSRLFLQWLLVNSQLFASAWRFEDTNDPSREVSSLDCFFEFQKQFQNVKIKEVKHQDGPHEECWNKTNCVKTKCPRLRWTHTMGRGMCEVPPFDPHVFLETMSGRTLVFAGDSTNKLLCLELEQRLAKYALTKPVLASSKVDPFDRGAMFGCKIYKYDVIVCYGNVAFGPRNNQHMFRRSDGILVDNLKPADIVLWNVGVHFNDVESLEPLVELVNKTLSDYEKNKETLQLPRLWWRETYPQHFQSGHYRPVIPGKKKKKNNCPKTGGCCDISNIPIVNVTGPYNRLTEPLLERFGVPIVRLYRSAVPLYRSHYNPKSDCLHFCRGEFGPLDHDLAFFQALLLSAKKSNVLPAPIEGEGELQRRWDLLMEDVNRSAMAKMEVCSNARFKWDMRPESEGGDGPLPPTLSNCIERQRRQKDGG
jgi:hypothetical protein